MKTFKDLVFETHPVGSGVQARITLEDGAEISVIQGKYFYSGDGTYEMMSDRITSNRGIIGGVTPEEITEHMIHVQKNPKNAKAAV